MSGYRIRFKGDQSSDFGSSDFLMHFGIRGQKWGIRRFQNEDRTLTEAGKERYYKNGSGEGKKSLKQKIKDNWESAMYPPELRGKSKEEKKAWEQKEKEKWNEEYKKESEYLEIGRRMNDFDKMDGSDQQKILDDVDNQIKQLESKKKLTHDEDKYLDGLKDWYGQKDAERSFNDSREYIQKHGFMAWNEKYGDTDKWEKLIDHVWNKEGKLLNDWWNKRFDERYRDPEAGRKMQDAYVKKLAKALDLPMNDDTYYSLRDWFINYDD